jgi:hypothetical protein
VRRGIALGDALRVKTYDADARRHLFGEPTS